MSGSSVATAISLNGVDNVGKTTQLRWLGRAMPLATPMGTVDRWDARWAEVAAGDFSRWWFEASSTDEHVELVFAGHAARRRASGRLAIEDRGRPMLIALCAATAMVKDGLDPESAIETVEQLAACHPAPDRREIHVLLRHAAEPVGEAAMAVAREERPASRWYPDYQRALAQVVDLQSHNGGYDLTVVRDERPILDVHRELRERLREQGVDVPPLRVDSPQHLLVLGGMSESGKSTVGELLQTEHAATRLKIGYLMDLAAIRAGVDDPYVEWDEIEQAERLSEEIVRLCASNAGIALLSLESAHRHAATLHLKCIWGSRCQAVFVHATHDVRQSRTTETAEQLEARDRIKADRGADRIAGIADRVIDNSGSPAALKIGVATMVAAIIGGVGGVPAEWEAPPLLRPWLAQVVRRLTDAAVAAVLVTGSAACGDWRPGWSDVDLLVIRDRLPLEWLRGVVEVLPPFDGVKVAVTAFTTDEVRAQQVPPRLVHALRLAGRDGRGIAFRRDDFRLPAPSLAADDRASRSDLGLVAMRLRRLAAAEPLDVRATYKHLVLLMKIILRANGVEAERGDEVARAFGSAHPGMPLDLPELEQIVSVDWRTDQRIAARVRAAAGTVLACHDALWRSTLSEGDRQAGPAGR